MARGFDQWDREELGDHIGYLPQGVELFDGTIAENICRFETDADAGAIVAAARAAGAHDLILRFDSGYKSRIGEAGSALSAGQRQRIGLARALYCDPFLVVLDEPNANLDAEGEKAVVQAMASVRERKGIVVVVAHQSQRARRGGPRSRHQFRANEGLRTARRGVVAHPESRKSSPGHHADGRRLLGRVPRYRSVPRCGDGCHRTGYGQIAGPAYG